MLFHRIIIGSITIKLHIKYYKCNSFIYYGEYGELFNLNNFINLGRSVIQVLIN